ncbi:MAG: ACP S-malonyltransferase [Phycisphaeraceae bacterium]|nr:ACP S-malonyltransferase [Phycisphaeraceae bacterium]MBX3408808.1 ACP S-malonyltransferase [Phycisphaeraceae bacterium]
MPNPLVILCPGQGAQAVAMGKAWFDQSPEARETFEQADAVLGDRLGAPLTTLCFSGPAERLNQTDVSQPAIFTASVASWRGMLAHRSMAANDQPIHACAGLSLGEYTALHIAGAVSFQDCLELVTLRGRAMQDATDSAEARAGGGGGMLALIGASEEQAEQICDRARDGDVLVCANFNAPGQVVLSGHKNACERAAAAASEMGLRSTMLAVAGAFHSPLMSMAAKRLSAALAETQITPPRATVISNVTALPHDASADSIRRRLVDQLTSPVRWSQSCTWLAGNAPQPQADYIELAPGKTLAGLMRRIDKNIKVTSYDTP